MFRSSSLLTPPPKSDPPRIVERLQDGGRAVVALSGGVDSAVVAFLAHDALAEDAMAITLVGPAISSGEVERAQRVAEFIGIAHELVRVDPLANVDYRRNPSNRCYFCRSTETAALQRHVIGRGVRQFLDGVHLDDLGEERPGLKAMGEAGFLHPLVDAGWSKVEVRQFARDVHLPNSDAPSDACLASRIAHGQAITVEVLGRVERSEAWLRRQGFRRVRVRVRGDSARVEVGPEEVERLRQEPLAGEVEAELLRLGFQHVELDPAGYRVRPGA